jgi:hypothetical protein
MQLSNVFFAIVCGSVCLVAAEDVAGPRNSSLRATLTVLGDRADIEATSYNTVTSASATVSESGTWDDGAGRLSFAAYHNTGQPIAFNIGVGVAFTGYAANDDGLKQELSEFGIFVEPGVCFNVSPRFALECGIPLGLGAAAYKESEPGYSFEATDGSYIDYGIVLRPVGKFGRFQVFGELGWSGNHARFDRSAVDGMANVELEFDITTKGVYYSLGAGVAF